MIKREISVLNLRYEFVLVSLLLMMFHSLFFSPTITRYVALPISVLMVYSSSFLLFWESSKWMRWALGLLCVILFIGSTYFNLYVFGSDFRFRSDIAFLMCGFLIFWVTLLARLIVKIFEARDVSLNLIFASISGFVVLIFLGAVMFNLVDYFHPNSFKGLDMSNPNIFDEYIYFSFITQSSIGYGEILPSTPAAKKAVILMGTLGQFYLIVLVGLIVSKFASRRDIKD